MNDCIFCKIVRGEIPSTKIHETEDTFSFLDVRPLSAGHALVIPKVHYENIFDVPEDILAKVILETKKIAGVVKKVTNADGVGIGQNNGRAAGQVIDHIHFHIIPRYESDGYVSWSPKNKLTIDPVMAEKIVDELSKAG